MRPNVVVWFERVAIFQALLGIAAFLVMYSIFVPLFGSRTTMYMAVFMLLATTLGIWLILNVSRRHGRKSRWALLVLQGLNVMTSIRQIELAADLAALSQIVQTSLSAAIVVMLLTPDMKAWVTHQASAEEVSFLD